MTHSLTQGLMSKLFDSELKAMEKTVRYYNIYLNYLESKILAHIVIILNILH
jgi:hypothetical protein